MALEIIHLINGAKSLNRLVKVWNAEEQADANGLTLTEFLRVMLKVLPAKDESREGQLRLVESLVEMFKSVDVNGDRSMEWSEFSSFIAEIGLAASLPSSAAPVRVSYREREGFIDMTNQAPLDKIEVVEWPPVSPPASEAVKMALSGGRAPKPQRPIEVWTLETESAVLRVWEAGKRPTLQDPSGGTAPPGGDTGNEQTKADIAVILGIDPSKAPKTTKQQRLDAEMVKPKTAKQAAALRGATSLAPLRLKYQIDISARRPKVAGANPASTTSPARNATGRAAGSRGWAAGGGGRDAKAEAENVAGASSAASGAATSRERGPSAMMPKPSIQGWQMMWDQKLLAIAQSDCRISIWNVPEGGPPGPPPGLRPGASLESVDRVGGSGAAGDEMGTSAARRAPRLPQGGFTQLGCIITRGPPTAMAYCRQLLYATDTCGKGSIVAYHIPSLQLVHRWKPHSDLVPCILALTPRALGFSRSSTAAAPEATLPSRSAGGSPGASPRSTTTVSSARSRGLAGAPVVTAALGSGGMLVSASLDGTVRCMNLSASLESVVAEFNRRKRAEQALRKAGQDSDGISGGSESEAVGSDEEEEPAGSGETGEGGPSNLAALLSKRKRITVSETTADGKPQYPLVPAVAEGSPTLDTLTPHPRGVRHLCFVAAEGLLVTSGFDQDAKAFELPGGRLKLTLKGHRHPVVQAREVWQGHGGIGLGGAGLHAVPRPKPPALRRSAADVVEGGASEHVAAGDMVHARCLTLDQSSCFRLWDMRPNPTGLAACLLQFDTGSAMPGSFASYRTHCFGVVRWSGDLVVGGTKLHHLVPLAHANETFSPAIVVYNPLLHCFYIMGGARATSSGSVRVFDAKTGNLARTFPDMSPAPVTVAALDDRQRKLIVGTQDGDVTVHNAASGGLMKAVDKAFPSGKEVTAMEYVVGTKLLLTASWDRTVRLYDEDPPHACLGVRSVARAHDADIVAASASNNLVLMASADAHSFVKVWDMETLKLDGACIGHGGGVNCLQFVEPYPLLLVTDKEGRVVVWGMRGTSKSALYQPVVLLRNQSRRREEATNVESGSQDDDDGDTDAAAKTTAPLEDRKRVAVTSVAQTYWPFDIDDESEFGHAFVDGDTSGDVAAVRQGLGLAPLGSGEGAEAQASAEMHSPAAYHKESHTGRAVPDRGHGGARRVLVLADEGGWVTVVDLTQMIRRSRVQAFVRGAGDAANGRPSSSKSQHGVELAVARRMSADVTAAGIRLRTAPQARTAGTAAAARRLSVSMPGAEVPMATVDGSTAAAAEVMGTQEEEEAEGAAAARRTGARRSGGRVEPDNTRVGRIRGRHTGLTGADAAAAGRLRRRSLLQQAHISAVEEMHRPVIGQSMQSLTMMGMDMEAEQLVGGSHRADKIRKRAQTVASQILAMSAAGKKNSTHRGDGLQSPHADPAARVEVVGNRVVRQVKAGTRGGAFSTAGTHMLDSSSALGALVAEQHTSKRATAKHGNGHGRRRRRRNSILASGNDEEWTVDSSRMKGPKGMMDAAGAGAGGATAHDMPQLARATTNDAGSEHTALGNAGTDRSGGGMSMARRPVTSSTAYSNEEDTWASTQQVAFEGLARSAVFVPLSQTGITQAVAQADAQMRETQEQQVSAARERMVRRSPSKHGGAGFGPGSPARPGLPDSKGPSLSRGRSMSPSPMSPSLGGGSPPDARKTVASFGSGAKQEEGRAAMLERVAKAEAAMAEKETRLRWEEAMQQHQKAVRDRMHQVDATGELWEAPLACWKAHEGGVTQVVAIKDPPSVVTSGIDGSVKVWSLRGALLGVILSSRRELALERLGLATHPAWQFQWDEVRESRIRRQEARQALRLMAEEDEGKSLIQSAAAKDNDAVMDDAIVLSKYLTTGEVGNSTRVGGQPAVDGPSASSRLSDAPSAFELGGGVSRSGSDDEAEEGATARFRSLEDLERSAIASAISHSRRMADTAAGSDADAAAAGGGGTTSGAVGPRIDRVIALTTRKLSMRAQSSLRAKGGSRADASSSPSGAGATQPTGLRQGGVTKSRFAEDDSFGMGDAELRLQRKEEQWHVEQLAAVDAASVLRARAAFAAARAGDVEAVARFCGVKQPQMEGSHLHLLSEDGVIVGSHVREGRDDLSSTGGVPPGSFEAVVKAVGLRPPERPEPSNVRRPAAATRALEQRYMELFKTAAAAITVLQRLLQLDMSAEAAQGRPLWEGEGTALPLPEGMRRSILLSDATALLAVSMAGIEQDSDGSSQGSEEGATEARNRADSVGSIGGGNADLGGGSDSFGGIPLSARARIILSGDAGRGPGDLDNLEGVGLVESDDDLGLDTDLTDPAPTHRGLESPDASAVLSGVESSQMQLGPATANLEAMRVHAASDAHQVGGGMPGPGRHQSSSLSSQSSLSSDAAAASISEKVSSVATREKQLRRARSLARVDEATKLARVFGSSESERTTPALVAAPKPAGGTVAKFAETATTCRLEALLPVRPAVASSPMSHAGSRSTLAPPPTTIGRSVAFAGGNLPTVATSPTCHAGAFGNASPLKRKPSLADALKSAVTSQLHEESSKRGDVVREMTVGRALIRRPRQSRRLQGTLRQLATITDRERYQTDSGAVATTEDEMREPSALRVSKQGGGDADDGDDDDEADDAGEEMGVAELLNTISGGREPAEVEDDSDLRELMDVMGAGRRAAELLEEHLRGEQKVAIEDTYRNLRQAVSEKRSGGAGVQLSGGRQVTPGHVVVVALDACPRVGKL